MAKRKSAKRTHVSPGVYYKETELEYSTKSLGITTLGLPGETLKGPAFQPISISDWREFQSYFGGTSTEKFRGSQYPKYELPYIAQEYLKQSKQLEVVRVLGFSGVNAGPAWIITGTKHNCTKGWEYVEESSEYQLPTNLKTTEYKNGYYETTVTENDESKVYAYSFVKPGPFVDDNNITEEELSENVGVIDGYINLNSGIMIFDDEAEAEIYYEQLPEALKNAFIPTDEENKTPFEKLKENFESKPIFYIGFDNGIKNGRFSIVFDYDVVDEIGVVTKKSAILEDGNIGEDGYFAKKIEELLPEGIENYSVNDFKVYQYGFTEIEENIIIENSGKCNQYVRHASEEVCIEDVNNTKNNIVLAVLRSRGEHKTAVQTGLDECGNPVYSYDGIEYYAKNVKLTPSKTLTLGDSCSPGFNTTTGDFNVDAGNYGRFNIVVESTRGYNNLVQEYSVSLNPTEKNYITKVLGTNPEVGDADIYVEELYDIALEQLIYSGEINSINSEIVKYPYVSIVPEHAPVTDLLTIDSTNLNKTHLGKRYLYTYSESKQSGIKVKVSKNNGTTWEEETDGIVGHIYTVMYYNNPNTGKREYFYGEYRNENNGILKGIKKYTEYLSLYNYYHDIVKTDFILRNCVKVGRDNSYYVYTECNGIKDVIPITLDFNNYKEEYRYASTPWIVSEMKGSGDNVNLHKLFRFHTISDGSNANTEIKISIENIDPDMETFDVLVRAFRDSDVNPQVLERFGKCTLIPGDSNYLGLKIGDIHGTYVSNSTYITVEINEDDITSMSIPCGFLGYPVRNYNGFGVYNIENGSLSSSIKQPYIKFNNYIDDNIKIKKQYFGMSDLIGIDEDILSYKGIEAYNEEPEFLTPCFHLDSRILNGAPTGIENGQYYVEEEGEGLKQIVSVDGTTGYNWVTVSRAQITDAGIEPRIGGSEVMENTIYEDKNARKFTLCFYGGWDGWDYYRTSRTNRDEYQQNKYKGFIDKSSGQGSMFSTLMNPEVYGFSPETKLITSDYYAYLAAVKQLDNPKIVDINLFATPGIDYVNQTALVNDIISIIEEDRGDALYVVTTPDKPFGAGDSKSEMYSAEEVVYNLEDSGIDSNYVCTYYPWEQYYDSSNNQYIYLPVTRDVVRNMAYTDNIAYPWYATAGWNRGDINGVAPKRKLKLNEQDVLYEGRINYINSFAKEGDRIWGDKNLQIHDGIMNRISKRRLLIRLKTLLSDACVGLLFDPNDNSMANTFRSSIKSVLEPIKQNRGITDFRIEIDDSAEARDRLELPARVFIKPTQMLEYINIDLVVTPQGVVWN